MDFGTPILFKYSLLKEIICTLDNISLIYFFTIIFFSYLVLFPYVFLLNTFKKKFEFDFDYLLFWGDLYL